MLRGLLMVCLSSVHLGMARSEFGTRQQARLSGQSSSTGRTRSKSVCSPTAPKSLLVALTTRFRSILWLTVSCSKLIAAMFGHWHVSTPSSKATVSPLAVTTATLDLLTLAPIDSIAGRRFRLTDRDGQEDRPSPPRGWAGGQDAGAGGRHRSRHLMREHGTSPYRAESWESTTKSASLAGIAWWPWSVKNVLRNKRTRYTSLAHKL